VRDVHGPGIKTAIAADGRRITFESWGDTQGRPVMLMHGMPGSRLGPHPRASQLYQQGIHLIAFDRPGYGGSSRLVGRRIADAAADAAAVAEELGIDRFAVVGRSGGGPHALAVAALLPKHTTRAAVLVGLAPFDAEGLDWFDGMTGANVREYTAASQSEEALSLRLAPQAASIRADPKRLFAHLDPDMPETDRQVVMNLAIRTMLTDNYAEALRESPAGWIDDAVALCTPWGFDPADIHVPVLLWHGEKDVFVPVSHTRWLADRIPGARSVVHPGASHFGALPILPEILSWLAEADGPPQP
jgi:pimeloyl-ACP methyl ester carboxylesterase